MIFKSPLYSETLGVGNYYQGGYIAYMDLNAKQGLIVSPIDLTGSLCAWEQPTYQSVSTSNTYGTGAQNTTNIVALSSTTPAADLCNNYINDGYTDWFLPNQTELLLVFDAYNLGLLNAANIRGFRTFPNQGTQGYWTSYSLAFNTARFIDFQVPSSYAGQVGDGFRCCGPISVGSGLWVRACRYMTFYT